MLPIAEQKQFSSILEQLGKNLDITPAQHAAAVKSYEFVGDWLSQPDSPLSPYKPQINPHGSFLIGTVNQPIHEDDELDVDLVCRLMGKRPEWTQYDLKKIVGDRIRSHGTLARLLREEGRRCWTLGYAESARFHLDILPAITAQGYELIMERAFLSNNLQVDELGIRITDRTLTNYRSETELLLWMLSNPFGYAIWFEERGRVDQQKLFSLRNSIKPIPTYQPNKTPLQRIVQLLKRHRDLMFNGDEFKPISIIITTLAARAYRKQTDIAQGLMDVINEMELHIEDRYDPVLKRNIKWIANPVNPCENFADKWPLTPQKEEYFYRWLKHVKTDVAQIYEQRGLQRIQASMGSAFGSREVNKTFSDLGNKAFTDRESGALRMAAGTGIISSIGRTSIVKHNNFGIDG